MVLNYEVKFRFARVDLGKVKGSKVFDLTTPNHSFSFGKYDFYANFDLQTYADGSADIVFKTFYKKGWFAIPISTNKIHIATLLNAGVIFNDRGILLEIK